MASASKQMPLISAISLHLVVEQVSQDIVNNTSTVSYRAYLYNPNKTYYYNWPNNMSMVVTVNGVNVKTNNSVLYDFRSGAREQAVLEGTAVIPHASDGTKTLVASVKVTASAAHPGCGSETVSLSMALTTIPRASELTAFSNFTSDSSALNVTVDRKSSAFTQEFKLVVNGKTIGTWTSNFSGSSTLALSATHKNNLLDALPTQTSAIATLTLTTKSGTTVVGTRSRSATFSVASNVVPIISGVSVDVTTPAGAISGRSRSYAVQNISTAKISYTPTAPRGATIKSAKVELGAQSSTANPASIKPKASGSNAIKITVTDSRGRSAVHNTSLNVIAYAPCSAQLIELTRTAANQTLINIRLKLTVAAINSGGVSNAFKVVVTTRPTDNSASANTPVNTTYNPASASGIEYPYNPSATYLETKAYNTTIVVTDDFSSVTLIGILPTAAYPLVIGKHGIGVGGVPQPGRVLDVYDPVNEGIFVNNDLWTGGIYETGSNSNGTYIKFTNGLMICMAVKTINTNDFVTLNDTAYVTAGSPFKYSRIDSQTMPATFTVCFYQNAVVNGSSLVQARSREIFMKMAWGSPLDYVNRTLWDRPAIYHCGTLSADGTITFSFFAIGLWK